MQAQNDYLSTNKSIKSYIHTTKLKNKKRQTQERGSVIMKDSWWLVISVSK